MFAVAEQKLDVYLEPTFFIDSDSPEIIEYAKLACGDAETNMNKAIRLFYAVRDDIRYDVFGFEISPSYLKASYILKKSSGYCVSKAIVLASVARAVGIPSRLGFADVVNHLNPGKLQEFLQTDIFAFHGFTELYLNEKWVRATPSFDYHLCKKNGYFVPEFNGIDDTKYPAFDINGTRHMEYVAYHGSYSDLPVEEFLNSVTKHYPHFFPQGITAKSIIEDAGLKYTDVIRNDKLEYSPCC